MGTLEDQMVAIHELYLSSLRAGFTEEQAMQITIALLIRGGGSPNE